VVANLSQANARDEPNIARSKNCDSHNLRLALQVIVQNSRDGVKIPWHSLHC
jgi:hypothetical protein